MSSHAPAFVALKKRLSRGEKAQLEHEIRVIRESSAPPYRKAKLLQSLYNKWIRVARERKDAYRANQTSTGKKAKKIRARAVQAKGRVKKMRKEAGDLPDEHHGEEA